jgi:flagellar biogenesis protein FliO
MMRAMLEPIFGSGAGVAQFILTLIIVFGLVALVVWLVRRYGGNAFGAVSRNRAPRLALVDALPVDGRRRLVLVRRDNVEHLLLIGGTTDIVVEPTIIRGVSMGVRQRQAQAMRANGQQPVPQPPPVAEAPVQEQPVPVPMPADLAPQLAPQQPAPRRAPPPVASEPIPFPQPARAEEAPAPPPPPPPEQPADIQIRRVPPGPRPAARFAETARPTRIESVFSLADALDEIADEPAAPPAPEILRPPPRAEQRAEPAPVEAEDSLPEYLTLANDEPAPATAAEEFAEGPPAAGEGPSKVSDLEREMARLLGEITSKRGG